MRFTGRSTSWTSTTSARAGVAIVADRRRARSGDPTCDGPAERGALGRRIEPDALAEMLVRDPPRVRDGVHDLQSSADRGLVVAGARYDHGMTIGRSRRVVVDLDPDPGVAIDHPDHDAAAHMEDGIRDQLRDAEDRRVGEIGALAVLQLALDPSTSRLRSARNRLQVSALTARFAPSRRNGGYVGLITRKAEITQPNRSLPSTERRVVMHSCPCRASCAVGARLLRAKLNPTIRVITMAM